MDPLAEHDAAQQLLAAWVLHVCEPDEMRLVEAHVDRCSVCADDVVDLTESAGSLAELAPVEEPPAEVWDGIAAAVARGRSGRPVDAYNELVVQLAELLRDLRDDDFALEAVPGWSVLDLVAHLTAVDGAFSAVLRAPGREVPPDLDASTEQAVALARRQPPERTVDLWRRQAAEIGVLVATGGERMLDRRVPFAGFELPVRTVVLDRAFETWIHAEDIARATGRSLAGPPPGHVAMLSDTAISLIPAVLEVLGRTTAGVARVTLTGPGGGSWDVPLGADGPPVVDLSMDVMEFCHLVGGRREVATVPRQVRGQVGRADDVLLAAAALARP